MSENAPEEGVRQDPAEPNQVEQSVDTSNQPPADDAGDSSDDEPAAPEPVEPAPVEVAPADQSSVLKTDKVFDKEYTVDPDKGYRVKKD